MNHIGVFLPRIICKICKNSLPTTNNSSLILLKSAFVLIFISVVNNSFLFANTNDQDDAFLQESYLTQLDKFTQVSLDLCNDAYEDKDPQLSASIFNQKDKYFTKQVYQINLPVTLCLRAVQDKDRQDHSKSALKSDDITSHNIPDELSSAQSSYFNPFYIEYYAQLQLSINYKSETSISTPDNSLLDLSSAYAGLLFNENILSRVGFITAGFYNSRLLSYNKALFTYSIGYFKEDFKTELLFSAIDYNKKQLPNISDNTPYSLTLIMSYNLNADYFYIFDRVVGYANFADDIPTELAHEYLKRGNSVRTGKYFSQMSSKMNTYGAVVTYDVALTTKDKIGGAVEAAVNPAAQKSSSAALLTEIFYTRAYSPNGSKASFVGYRAYSIGSDAYLSEFANEHLGYTSVDGHQFVLGYKFRDVNLELSYVSYKPRVHSPYKHETSSLMFSVNYKESVRD